MAISLQVASAVRVTVRGTAYLPSPLLIAQGTAEAAASASSAASSASAASASASAAAASAASISLPIVAASGGTGQTSYTAGDILYASGTTALSKLAAASTGNVLLSGTTPSWGKVGLSTAVSGTLLVANGGTGATSQTAYAVLCAGTTSTGALQSIASVGTTGQVLTSNGAGALPTFQAGPVFTKSYVSSQQTITAAGTLTLAHGLGAAPKLVTATLVCASASGGFTVGQEFDIVIGYMDTNRGVNVIRDATNLTVRYGSSATTFIALNPTSGVTGALTNADFRLVLRAYA